MTGDRQTHAARDVREGEIMLRTPARKWLFFGGMAAVAAVVLLPGPMA